MGEKYQFGEKLSFVYCSQVRDKSRASEDRSSRSLCRSSGCSQLYWQEDGAVQSLETKASDSPLFLGTVLDYGIDPFADICREPGRHERIAAILTAFFGG